ncbi:hypothetical protein AAFF_G00102200 [Aldrovandia affinis]|uniref:MICOS complex subunit n=1 Tax=Aldrovandia affinis TaxID=143900 RepID=A0AAD7WC93_9TELE|nr:hypothetical protein AAFF_G00102200 [Aldrovandia affinis]
MYKVAGLTAAPSTLCLMSGTVFAASEEKRDTTLKTNELSLYTVPQQKFRYVVPEAGWLEQSVTLWRKTAEPYTTRCQQTGLAVTEKAQGVYREVKPKVESPIQFVKDSCEYLRDPPSGFYPRVGVIGFAGILGLFLARGSRVKKLIYPTGLMALGTSMYYPKQAASVAKVTGDTVANPRLSSLRKRSGSLRTAAERVKSKHERSRCSVSGVTRGSRVYLGNTVPPNHCVKQVISFHLLGPALALASSSLSVTPPQRTGPVTDV